MYICSIGIQKVFAQIQDVRYGSMVASCVYGWTILNVTPVAVFYYILVFKIKCTRLRMPSYCESGKGADVLSFI